MGRFILSLLNFSIWIINYSMSNSVLGFFFFFGPTAHQMPRILFDHGMSSANLSFCCVLEVVNRSLFEQGHTWELFFPAGRDHSEGGHIPDLFH